MKRRSISISGLVLGIALAANLMVPSAVGAAGRGALWHVFTYIHCDEPTCGGSELLPPWMETLRNPFVAVTDGRGHFYHRASIITKGRSGHPARCDQSLFNEPFSGRCVVRDFGEGYLAPGGAPGIRDFWVTSETARFNGGPWIVDPFAPYPIDTSQYAKPGHYSEVDLLGQDYAGVVLYMDVTRQAR